MAIEVKHKFVSGKGDGSDTTLVRPTNWNDTHNIEMATNKMIARLTAGDGPAEEHAVTPYMIGLMNTADQNALLAALGLPSTGDAKFTFKTSADTGWVMMNDGSIGNAGSNATTYAHADTVALFTLLYNAPFTDAIVPLQTSAGASITRAAAGSAATAFGTLCRLVLPKQLGRTLLVGGSGAGLTGHLLGTTGGAETHTITVQESVDHLHRVVPTTSLLEADRYLRVADVKTDALAVDAANAGAPLPAMDDSPPTIAPAQAPTASMTGSAWNLANNIQFEDPPNPMPIMQPWTAWNVMIKL